MSPRVPRFGVGIRDRLLLAFALLITCIAAFVYIYFPGRLARQAQRGVAEKAEVVRDLAAYSLRAGVVFDDREAIAEVLAGAAQNPDVLMLIVRDSASREIARRAGDSPDAQAALASGRLVSTSEAIVTSTPIVHDGRVVGSVTVVASLEGVQEAVTMARRHGALGSGMLFLVGIGLVYAISTLVTRPLEAVADTVGRIAAGDLDLRAEETSIAEVAQLVRAFNGMVDSLAGAQQELSASNQQLEARVSARTSELRAAAERQRVAQEALARSEAEARASNEMLQSIIDLAPQAIIGVDAEWRVTRWNRAAEALLGWTAAEVLGGPLPHLGPEDERALAELRSRLESGRAAVPAEEHYRRKDGTPVAVLCSSGALRDSRGEGMGAITIATDLTERNSLEEQLRQSQKMEAIGRLAGGVAHDFNNLLTVITTSTALLLEGNPSASDREDLEAVAGAAARAAALVQQLLLFSRKQVLRPQEIRINDVVREVEPMLRRLLPENVAVTVGLGANVGAVIADPTQLHQVVMNLAVNAVDAMPHGGSLSIETLDVELDEEYASHHPAAQPGPHVRLLVRDTGHGMDAATVSRIFEPFFTTKPVGKGTGLGLATTYAVVTQLGGHIDVQSAPGAGTSFTIYLPRHEAARVVGVPTPARPTSPAGRKATVLLVEDEEAVRIAIRRMLERAGYEILEASNGERGLVLALRYAGPIDVVVTDMTMPGMNGDEFAAALLRTQPELGVVFMSGYTDESAGRLELAGSSRPFLQKPFSPEQLIAAIRSLLPDARPAAA